MHAHPSEGGDMIQLIRVKKRKDFKVLQAPTRPRGTDLSPGR